MRNKMVSLFLALAVCLSLTACGGSKVAEPAPIKSEPTAVAEPAPVEPEPTAVAEPETVEPEPTTTTETDLTEPTPTATEEPAESAEPAEPEDDALVAALEARYIGLTEDALSWDYDDSTNTLTISGEGPMREYLETEPEWYAYCDTAEHIVIGDGVTSVGEGAFEYFSSLYDVKLGSSVEFIGDFAFYLCWSLWNVNFPDELKYVGEGAFTNALLHSDGGFVFPEGMLYLDDGSFFSAFKESFVSIPATLTFIGENAFANCFVDEFRVSPDNPAYTCENGILYDKNIETLINYPPDKTDTLYEVPESVTTILDDSIEVTNTLEKIVIPASVSFIDEGAIYWNYALTSVEVDESNAFYKSVDGVLFSKDGKTLLCYPTDYPATEYTIPDGCERIGMAGISLAQNLTSLSIPEGVREIGLWGIENCPVLSQLFLPKSLTKIEAQALDDCNSLSEVCYAGSSDDWQKIEIDEDNDFILGGNFPVTFAE